MSKHTLSSLNLLRAFEAAARLGSFREAGEELNVTASAISQQVKVLEEQLGVTLFERQPRGLVLNDVGRQYANAIRPHLSALDEATRLLLETHPQVLRVTLMPPLANRLVFPRLADFRARHPDIELRIDTNLKYLDLQQRHVDLAVRFGMPPWPGCVWEKLADLHFCIICSPAVASEYGLRDNPRNIAKVPLVHMTTRPERWPRVFAELGLPPPARDGYHVDDYPASIEAATSLGAALAVMPLEQLLIDSGRVVAVGPDLGPLPEAIYAVMLPERQHQPEIQAFLDWLREQLASLG